ncbi:lipoyl domain-containing protein [Haloarchaeobius litoreus]|uniref:Lipoyl domain-containing protein n=1 Tax=Haloarchaeobius litoreus TaxID=755306 RepID=A0ABD6DL32_9EURY|nr:lipoyl domain-containing protein [Haloarchaeobius litoreus]
MTRRGSDPGRAVTPCGGPTPAAPLRCDGGDRVAVTPESVWPEDAEPDDEGVVVNWFAREGASVSAGESLCECQIEKVSFDVPAPVAGELDEIVKREDDTITRSDTVAWIRPT